MSLFRRTVPGEFELCVLKDSMLQSEAKLYIECYETDETHDVSSLKVYSDTIKLGIPHCIPAKFTKSDLEKRILKCLEKIVETKTTTVAVNVDAVKTWNTTGFVYTLLKCFHEYAHTDPKWVYLRLTVCSIQQQVCESAKKACAALLSMLADNASEDAEQALHSVQDFDPSKKHNMGVSKEQPDDINKFYHRSGKEFQCIYSSGMRFYNKEWQPFPKRWYNEGLLGTDTILKGDNQKDEDIVFETFYHRSGKEYQCIYQSGMRFYRDDGGSKPPAAISPYGHNVAAQLAAQVAANLVTDKDHAHHPPDQQGSPQAFQHPHAPATAVDKTHVVPPLAKAKPAATKPAAQVGKPLPKPLPKAPAKGKK